MTAKILYQARKQQSELQDEYGVGDDQDQDDNNNVNTFSRASTGGSNLSGPRGDGKQPVSFDLVDHDDEGNNFLSRPFKKFQTNFKQQQKIRKSDHDDSDSDSDTDEQLENSENKRDLFSDDEIVSLLF